MMTEQTAAAAGTAGPVYVVEWHRGGYRIWSNASRQWLRDYRSGDQAALQERADFLNGEHARRERARTIDALLVGARRRLDDVGSGVGVTMADMILGGIAGDAAGLEARDRAVRLANRLVCDIIERLPVESPARDPLWCLAHVCLALAWPTEAERYLGQARAFWPGLAVQP